MNMIPQIKKFFGSLRGRLILSLTVINAVIMIIFIINLTYKHLDMIIDHQRDDVQGIAQVLSIYSAEWISSNNVASLQDLINSQSHNAEIDYIIITDEKGQILAHTDQTRIGQYLHHLPRNLKKSFISDGSGLIDLIVPVTLAKENVGWVRVGFGGKTTAEKLRQITYHGVLYGLLAILFGSLIAWFMGHYFTRKFYDIQETIHQVAKGNSKVRSQVTGYDESALLAQELNNMLDIKEKYEVELQKNIKTLEDYKFVIDQSTISSIADSYGVILSVNDNFCEISKYSREELIGKTHRIINSGFHPNSFFEEMWQTLQSGKVCHNEIRNKSKEGEYYWVNETIIPIVDSNNNSFQYLAISFDITKKKKVEEEIIKAKDQAEESDRLKSAFLANMSHEIRTPMNGILGFAELLKDPEISGQDQQEYIRIIERSGIRMLNIINDIVDISKIEAGLMTVSISETNINKQMEYIYTFFKPEIKEKKLQLSYTSPLPEQEVIIKTDHEKVYAVLINLVKNAIKYTPEGSIEFGYTLKPSNKLGNTAELEFYVKDTGIGIPKEKQKAVFERFIQIETSEKRAFEGSGLGLSISKAYVEILGGKIWLESEEGKGTTFYFTIPYTLEPKKNSIPEKKPAAIKENNQIKNLKILVVEDDLISKLLLTKAVSKYSDTIYKASTGVEAVDTSLNNPDIDLIMMDINMPLMNGLEATKIIRQSNKEVIIIAQTAYGMSNDREKAIAAGCNDYISKPIDIDKLKELITKYFYI